MSIDIDKKGFPRLKEDSLELGTIISPIKSGTGRGNSAHDSFSGRFTFLPPGVQILEGMELAKGLSSATAQLFRDRAKATSANQAVLRVVNGNLHFVLLKNGKKMNSFAIQPEDVRKGVKQEQPARLTDQESIAIIKLARNLGLSGEKLKNRINEMFTGIAPDQIQQIEHEVDRQRILDLVMYLDQRLRIELKGEKITDEEIRIGVGRGFMRRSFATIEKPQLLDIIQKLEGLGWSTDQVNKGLVGKVPKRLKESLNGKQQKKTDPAAAGPVI